MAGIAEKVAELYERAAGSNPPVRADIPRGKLVDLAEGARFYELDRLEQYYRCRQDEGKEYDWDGNIRNRDTVTVPGWYVPLRLRKPDARYELARIIVNRLTSMLFGVDGFPTINVDTDPDTEDYVRELARLARLPVKMQEARRLGGACGTVGLSIGFVRGRPRVEVHNAKHCRVIEWADRGNMRPAKVLKVYAYEEEVWNQEKRAFSSELFYCVRYWDQVTEVVWPRVHEEYAKRENWMVFAEEPETHVHGAGFCPFYWVQNLPASECVDGVSDFEGLQDLFDEVNRVMSGGTKAIKANGDPTLVVRDQPTAADGTLRKGSGNAIFSPGGAEYLELKGESVRTAREWLEVMRASAFEVAEVVSPDAEKLSGAAQSAAALRILFQPMLAKTSILRSQYGDLGIIPVLEGLLAMARAILESPPREAEEGQMVRPELDIPPRVERDGESRRLVERKPGAGETITLSWPSYFPPTVNDTKLATSAAKDASGGKQLLSRKSALEWLSSHFGVQDIDEELLALEDDAEKAREDAEAIFGGGPPVRTNALPPRTREPADKPSSPADQEEGDEGDER